MLRVRSVYCRYNKCNGKEVVPAVKDNRAAVMAAVKDNDRTAMQI